MLTRKNVVKFAAKPAKQMDDYTPRPQRVAAGSGLLSQAFAAIDALELAPLHQPTTVTVAESLHMGRVKALQCVLCRRLGLPQQSATEVHHLREEQGGAQRASNWLTAALCGEGCHRGDHGIHGDRRLLLQAKCTEIDLLAWTLEDLAVQKGLA